MTFLFFAFFLFADYQFLYGAGKSKSKRGNIRKIFQSFIDTSFKQITTLEDTLTCCSGAEQLKWILDKLTYGMQYASFKSWVSPKFTIHKQHQHCINLRLYSFFLSLHVNNSDWSSIKLLLTQINRWILFRFVVFRLPKSPLLQFVFLWNIIYTWSKVDG